MAGPTHHGPATEATNGTLMRRASRAAVAVAASLAALKLAGWMVTGSVAILSSFLDSLLDAAASLVNLWAIHVSLSPADHEHRFGHGKAEALAGLVQAAFVSGSALFVAVEAGQRLLAPKPLAAGAVGVAIMGVSIVATLALVRYQRAVIARTQSLAIRGDSLHYVGDILTNAAVLLAVLASTQLGWHIADPVLAFTVVGVLLFGAVQIARGAIDTLMDRELPDADRDAILAIARADPGVLDCHDLRTRSAGQQDFIQLHLELDGDLPLRRAHAIGERVAAAIRARFPRADVIVHHDPSAAVAANPEP